MSFDYTHRIGRFGQGLPEPLRRAVQALALLMLILPVVAAAAGADASLIENGRRIYQEGVLPDGSLLRAQRPEGFVMEGEHAACVVCHRRSGMGSVEGNVDTTVLVPPVAGPVLFAPSRYATIPFDPAHHYIPTDAWLRILTRSAYDESSFARAVREGLDPDGKGLVSPMPSFNLDDAAVAALVAYLSQLTGTPAPGVDKDALHLATVVTPDVNPDRSEAVLSVLREWSSYSRGGSGVPWKLHVWKLSGDPDTWTTQLETYYRQRPVFALLSGVGSTEWVPVHQFCEQYGIPCILPSVDVAPDPGDGWYSVYYSPGVGLEAGILARYLQESGLTSAEGTKLIQLYADASGRYAARQLSDRLGSDAITVSKRRFRSISPASALKGIGAGDAVVLWLRPDEIMQLAAEMPQGPEAQTVYISTLLSAPEELSLPAAWKQRVRFVSLFDDLSLQGEIARQRLEERLESAGLTGLRYRRLQADAYAACVLFNEVLGRIRKQEIRRPAVPLSREHVLETLEKLVYKYSDSTDLVDTESHIAWYGRMSLGPRQRVAVRGGTILRYSSPDSTRLTAVSRRIVP